MGNKKYLFIKRELRAGWNDKAWSYFNYYIKKPSKTKGSLSVDTKLRAVNHVLLCYLWLKYFLSVYLNSCIREHKKMSYCSKRAIIIVGYINMSVDCQMLFAFCSTDKTSARILSVKGDVAQQHRSAKDGNTSYHWFRRCDQEETIRHTQFKSRKDWGRKIFK